jgi:hypothetical protein
MAENLNRSEHEMAEALLASGAIGVFIASQWSFAGEVGGCQAEGGSAAAMATAALVCLAGGTLKQSLAVASMAMQSMVGLICDPVGNRVEVPCLGKTVMAATNALACANMALANFDPVIPFDEVVQTAKRIALQMPRELRCTNLGGLSITPTSQAIEAQLAAWEAARRAAAVAFKWSRGWLYLALSQVQAALKFNESTRRTARGDCKGHRLYQRQRSYRTRKLRRVLRRTCKQSWAQLPQASISLSPKETRSRANADARCAERQGRNWQNGLHNPPSQPSAAAASARKYSNSGVSLIASSGSLTHGSLTRWC